MPKKPTNVKIQVGFPWGTRVCPGRGQRGNDEMWFLIDPDNEKPDDWNYWIIMDCPDNVRPWKLREIIPYWGLYGPPSGLIARIGEPLPGMAYNPPPPPDNPPYQSRARSSWEGY